ncbi:putative phosphoribosyltransferase [Promicromonospora umidemergens]|uniref:Phosphoribosyltransferase n=1 Tax=Promicromonospora umidemergens TaxID=629679 RepID=A0ABP8Y0U0_9MICO|nr:phosphoribosyltransferase [Promicromonospora umidemergens]MCP2284170.1 putative phosphoribosyltransferase [Promicromonospora umidemergens]
MPSDARPYVDRQEAGRALAGRLAGYADRRDVVVLALPRGGVPVAVPIAEALGAPLDIVVVRKLGLPGQPELAMGAIAGVGGDVEVVHNQRVLTQAQISEADFDVVYRSELEELRRRESVYRDGRPATAVRDRVVILVDDGVATGSTVLAAITAIRHHDPARVVVAVPIGSSRACTELEREADEVVCVQTPSPFYGVGQGYLNFRQTQDDEVRAALAGASDSTGRSP